ncbi:MAG: UdgX family uracil-DNA binding protein [Actinomycetales bacterium]
MVAHAVSRVGADEFVPHTSSLRTLDTAARACRGCELYERATQTVFGEGPPRAGLFLVGEQPGDVEDVEGAPFVGPAGRLLDKAMAEAGLDRNEVYVTNAVKHFRWRAAAAGKRRIHDTPAARHIAACQPWLEAELGVVRPRIVVALGAVAAVALLGAGFRLTQHRRELQTWPPPKGPYSDSELDIAGVLATVHPSAVLRARSDTRGELYSGLVRDLAQAGQMAAA